MGQEESFIELVTTIAIAEFETKKHIWSDTFGKPEKGFVSYDVENILGEDNVIDAKCDYDTTENYDEDYVDNNNLDASLMELVSKNMNFAKEEQHDYDETSGMAVIFPNNLAYHNSYY